MEYLNSKENYKKLFKEANNPVDVGNAIMHYVVENYEIEDRVEVIRTLLQTFANDFLVAELPKGEVERLRSIISRV